MFWQDFISSPKKDLVCSAHWWRVEVKVVFFIFKAQTFEEKNLADEKSDFLIQASIGGYKVHW